MNGDVEPNTKGEAEPNPNPELELVLLVVVVVEEVLDIPKVVRELGWIPNKQVVSPNALGLGGPNRLDEGPNKEVVAPNTGAVVLPKGLDAAGPNRDDEEEEEEEGDKEEAGKVQLGRESTQVLVPHGTGEESGPTKSEGLAFVD